MRPRKYRAVDNLTTTLELFEEQAGCCAICRRKLKIFGRDKGRTAALDHCHYSGFVRGLLCVQCNSALGLFGDNPATLTRAVLYLTHLRQRLAGFEDGVQYVPIWPIYCGDKTEEHVHPAAIERERKDFDDAMITAANRRCEAAHATA